MKIPGGDIRVITDSLIYIEDEAGIFFDIDEVEKILKRIGLKDRRVIIRDRNGTFDEMLFLKNRFYRFQQVFIDDSIIERILYYVELLEEKNYHHPFHDYIERYFSGR